MEINDSFLKTVGDSGANDILAEMGEITIDSIVGNDAISQIPIIGTLRSLYKINNSVSDYLFIQKLLKFFNELGQISDSKKEKMILRIGKDEKYRDRVGDDLLEIINKIDNSDKPRLIAKLFIAYIEEIISLEKFFKYSQIINHSFLPDLMKISDYDLGQVLSIEDSSSLLSLGLLEVKTIQRTGSVSMMSQAQNNQIEFVLNPNGRELSNLLN